MYEFLEAERAGYTIRLPASSVLQRRIDRSDDRRMRFAATTPASAIRRRAGTSRDASWPRSSGIRANFTRASASSSPAWLGLPSVSSPSTTSAARQSSGSERARGRSNGPCYPPHLRRQHRSPPVSRARLQPGQLHADAGDVQGGGAMFTDEPAGKADQDWREGRQPWPLRDV